MSTFDELSRYLAPVWPDEPFFLLALDGGWMIGPFGPDDWGTAPDGTVFYSDGITHPVTLRVRGQDGDIIHANDGSVARMDYRVIPVSQAPPGWLGRR
jgi:hypothetical protein